MGTLMIQMQVIYTALMAGMMLMYTITLGRYFDYFIIILGCRSTTQLYWLATR